MIAISAEYREKVARVHRDLGIPEDYAERCGLRLQAECTELVETEVDCFGRQPLLAPEAFAAWRAMKSAAAGEGLDLLIVSAFRSVDYQQGIFRRKLEAGQVIGDILQVNAAPGFSEHHSGRALDIGCAGVEPLSEAFEHSAAFAWLGERGGDFGFRLSFPRGNPHGVLYEPWHWCWAAE